MTGPPGDPCADHGEQERRIAKRIERGNPQWLVMWGCLLAPVLGLPLFNAQPGTIISAPSPQELITLMRQAESAAGPGPRSPPG